MKDVLGINKRDVTIDIIKGLGLVFMVLGGLVNNCIFSKGE